MTFERGEQQIYGPHHFLKKVNIIISIFFLTSFLTEREYWRILAQVLILLLPLRLPLISTCNNHHIRMQQSSSVRTCRGFSERWTLAGKLQSLTIFQNSTWCVLFSTSVKWVILVINRLIPLYIHPLHTEWMLHLQNIYFLKLHHCLWFCITSIYLSRHTLKKNIYHAWLLVVNSPSGYSYQFPFSWHYGSSKQPVRGKPTNSWVSEQQRVYIVVCKMVSWLSQHSGPKVQFDIPRNRYRPAGQGHGHSKNACANFRSRFIIILSWQ